MAACALLAALVGGCTSGGDPVPTPRPSGTSPPPPPPPDPCAGEGWDDVPTLARSDGPIEAISAVVTRPDGSLSHSLAGSVRLHVRVGTRPGSPPPTVYVDIDGRGSGAWTLGSSVSVAAWDLRFGPDGAQRHTGPSNEGAWEPLGVEPGPDYRWSPEVGELLVCFPTELLGDGHRVALGAEVDGDWLPRAFLPGLPYPPIREPGAMPLRVPGRLAIAYGYRPWVVRDCTEASPSTMACASEAYAAFDHVVLAAGLEDPEHASHDGTRRLVARLRTDHPEQELWGYVSMRRHGDREHTVEDIATRAAAWRTVGVTGVFLDEADLCLPGSASCTEAGVTRASQAAAIGAIHELGMAVFANGFSAPDLLAPFGGVPPALGPGTGDRAADVYLLENPTVAAGEWRTGIEADASIARMQAAIHAASTLGIRLAAVDTAAGWVEDDSTDPVYLAGWWRAVQAGVDVYAFTNPYYSATDDLGPNLAILEPPVGAGAFGDLAYASTSLRISDQGRRVSRDVVDCGGRDVGEVVTRAGPAGAVTGELVLRGEPACPD